MRARRQAALRPVAAAAAAVRGGDGRAVAAGLPGLGQHEGGLSLPLNERFGEDAILAGHFQATASRFAATTGLVLVVQDTTEFSFRGAKPETIGAIGRVPIGRDRNGNPRTYTQCGLLMHSSLVVTTVVRPVVETAGCAVQAAKGRLAGGH